MKGNKIGKNWNPEIRNYIKQTLGHVLEDLDVSNVKGIVDYVIVAAESFDSLEVYEKTVHEYLVACGVTPFRIAEKLTGRAELIYDQIKDYIVGHTVLDLGCGDGKVGELLSKQNLEVTLADIYEHEHVNSTGLRFLEKVPLGEKYDLTLLLTVLHHSEDPLITLKEAKKLTKKSGRIIVIESVYGVEIGDFGKLSSEQQRLTNVFFDHFYNRVIHYSDDPNKKVSVPFNFQTPTEWKKTFEDVGLVQIGFEELGIDQPIVPEYHTLHVLEK